jgi:hypothetical protein
MHHTRAGRQAGADGGDQAVFDEHVRVAGDGGHRVGVEHGGGASQQDVHGESLLESF